MDFTTGLILLFLNLFLPGILFLRFYFRGEFSKEFNTKAPIAKIAFYSLFPGMVIQLFSLLIYNSCDSRFTVYQSLEIFSSLLDNNYSEKQTKHFLTQNLNLYTYYTVSTAIGSIVFALIVKWVVMKFELDLKFKILRFKNQWYYIFSGEILRFPKYRLLATKLPTIQTIDSRKDVQLTYVDLLVKPNHDVEKYRGFVVDYELDANDLQQLDKLYLMQAEKYVSLSSNNKTWVAIPGDIFLIPYNDILNLNITYYPSKTKRSRKILKLLAYILILVTIFYSFFAIVLKIGWPEQLINTLSTYSWWNRLLFFSTIGSILTMPIDWERDENGKTLTSTWIVFVMTLLMLLLSILIVFYWYPPEKIKLFKFCSEWLNVGLQEFEILKMFGHKP